MSFIPDDLSCPASLDSLSTIAFWVLDVAQKAGLSKKSAYNLRLAIDEIATNVILYGHQRVNIAKDITLKAEINESSLVITLKDQGIPYDPTTRDLPSAEDLSLSLEEREIGGLGVFLALNSVDGFQYERADNYNYNIFIMNIDVQNQV